MVAVWAGHEVAGDSADGSCARTSAPGRREGVTRRGPLRRARLRCRLHRSEPTLTPARTSARREGVRARPSGGVGPLFEHRRRRHAGAVSEESVVLDIDDSGLARNLPRPVHRNDEIQGVPYRPVGFRDDDLPSALERSARWLRDVQEWLGEPVDVIGVHLDYDDSADGIYYEVKLLCNDEDLAGVPIALRARRSSPQ